MTVFWTVDVPFLKFVGKYKTSYKISYAEAFVLAQAEQEEAVVMSTDHHEFDDVAHAGELSFYWLR